MKIYLTCFLHRLRPYFLTLCKPSLTHEVCFDEKNFTKYVEDYECTTTDDPSGKHVREAAKSFFSGHSSFSFYCATFLIVFLHARLTEKLHHDTTEIGIPKADRWIRILFRGLRILRPFLQFGIFLLAFFICLTRVTDYKHHPTDVITGALIGVIYALILLMFVIKLFDKPVVFHFRRNPTERILEDGGRGSKQCNVKRTSEKSPLSNESAFKTHLPLTQVSR